MTKLTLEDVQVLGDLIDIAVKAGGFNVAEKAFPVVAKLRQIVYDLNQQSDITAEAAE